MLRKWPLESTLIKSIIFQEKEKKLKRELKVANLKTIVNLLNDIKKKEEELKKCECGI